MLKGSRSSYGNNKECTSFFCCRHTRGLGLTYRFYRTQTTVTLTSRPCNICWPSRCCLTEQLHARLQKQLTVRTPILA